MTNRRDDIFKRLTNVFREVFDDDELVIEDATSAQDIDEWDSLMHITLVVATEREFNLRLNAASIGSMKNVGEMVDLILAKTSE